MSEENAPEVKTHVCHQREDGQLIFGEILEFRNDPTEHVIRWDDNPVDEELNLFVYDKVFCEGEHVRRISDGQIGRISLVNCLASVSVNLGESKFILANIPIDRIQPISNIYPGLNVACDGWIGEVEEVKQEWRVKFPRADKSDVTCCKSLPLLPVPLEDQGQPQSRHSSLMPPPLQIDDLTSSYPYFKNRRTAVPGQKTKFSFRHLRYANWKGSTSWKRRPFVLAWHFKKKEATILSVKENYVKVSWESRYGHDAAKESPPPVFYNDECKLLKPRFIFPYEFIRGDSLAKVEWLETDNERLTTESAWNRELLQTTTRLDPSSRILAERVDDEATPAKRAWLDPNITIPEPETFVPVQIHAIRHELEVKWEDRTFSKIMASQVDKPFDLPTPDQPHKYLVMKPCVFCTDPDGHYFGVNLGPNGEHMIDVLWVLRKEIVGEVEGEQTVDEETEAVAVEDIEKSPSPSYEFVPQAVRRESVFDVAPQEDFCKFHHGNLVYPSEFCTDPNFDFGVIQQIGHDGRVVVRDGNLTPALRFWACEIQTTTIGQRIHEKHLKPLTDISQTLLESQGTLDALAPWDLDKLAPESHCFFSNQSFLEFFPLPTVENLDFKCSGIICFCTTCFRRVSGFVVTITAIVDHLSLLINFWQLQDLHSLLVIGPTATPFEDMTFTFDIYFPIQYPRDPPKVRLNRMSHILLSPYVRPDGFIDLKRLDPPLMEPPNSIDGGPGRIHSLCSVINALYESIFTSNPMEPADTNFDPENKTQAVEIAIGNQFACISSLEVCIHTLSNPPQPWNQHILGYYTETLPIIAQTVSGWVIEGAPFPLHPLTEGFKVSVNRRLEILRQLSDEVAASFSFMEN